jgi:hypothetical protein
LPRQAVPPQNRQYLQLDDDFLGIKATVVRQNLWEAKQRLRKRFHAQLGASRHALLGDGAQVLSSCHLKRARPCGTA